MSLNHLLVPPAGGSAWTSTVPSLASSIVPGSNGGEFFRAFQGDACPGVRSGAAATGFARPIGSSFGRTPANEWTGRPTEGCPPAAIAALPGTKAASAAIGAITLTPTRDRRINLIKAPPVRLLTTEAGRHRRRTGSDHPRRSWYPPADGYPRILRSSLQPYKALISAPTPRARTS